MQQAEILSYLKAFFNEYNCPITENSRSSIDVQLTAEMDKAIMNRPFYWHYIEKMGIEPAPKTLTFETEPGGDGSLSKGEFIHYGSPRLHQLFKYAVKQGKYGQFYEDIQPQGQAQPLKPWLCLNGKLTYQCHRKKEVFLSVGLSLINGEMLDDFHSLVKDMTLKETIPNLCFALSPLIKPQSGIERIRNNLLSRVQLEDHSWAEDAKQKMNENLLLLERLYEEIDPKPSSYDIERNAIIDQYDPSIEVNILSGALFYLQTHPLESGTKRHH